MFFIIVYDVEACKTQKLCDYLRQWMTWRQNSVFEGELTESEFKQVKSKLKELVGEDDQVIIYTASGPDLVDTETLGDDIDDERFL
jgi:CRISPR-associated protein Cas2